SRKAGERRVIPSGHAEGVNDLKNLTPRGVNDYEKLSSEGVKDSENRHNPMLLAAGIIELVGGGLVAIGLWTSYAAFIASGEVAVAYFIAHAAKGFWPILNKGELAILYTFVFLYIASRGSGVLSVEAVAKRKKRA
ncbi:DoxX family protein, partial [Candidatus Deferrimicrobium sp.]|uniref:DoxX family protein n=1 Tax=Candidatus Deferrimicrobium sp. TaxID=3060586 RepID=UPI002ED306A9